MTATVSQPRKIRPTPKPSLVDRYRPIGIASVVAAAMMQGQLQGA
ncbi:hypothetical protein [Bauldia litoralis]|uniref:Uncharacterized protein n=1 Tax=Bauldia litoralis TaxID=665467 RepID=A0A1G6BZY6_9HYPH|nr:hypothetical protein [Bauldia litoralis]SDB26138.1 hypothetical protein SAMN02982931_02056 [Bauldia litoralis]